MQALHMAARHNDAMLIRALMRSGADPDAEDGDGNVPLSYAIEFRALASVRALLAAGANPQAGSGSFTPVERAGHLLPAYPAIQAALEAAVAEPKALGDDEE
jgi:ankyrin repeat protein